MRFANNQITLEVANSNLLIYNIRPFTNTRSVRNLSPAFIGVGTITPLFPLYPEMLVKVAALFFIPVDILIDGFMRSQGLVIRFFKISMNLFRRPILQQSLVNLFLNGAINNVISTTLSFLFSILVIGIICAISVWQTAFKLSRQRTGVYVNLTSYIRFGNPLGIQIFYFYSLLQCYMFILQNLKFEEAR